MPDSSQNESTGQPLGTHSLNGSGEAEEPLIAHLPDDLPESKLLPFQVVGIGASAGGLEAYIELLRSLSPNTGMAFVIISHLSAEHKSQLLLIRLTQQAPIGSVEGCPDRRFPKRCGSFKTTSPPRRPANSTSRPVAGPMASSAPDADIGERTNW